MPARKGGLFFAPAMPNSFTPRPPTPPPTMRLFAFIALSLASVLLHAGVKPPVTGELYSYEGTLNLSELRADAGITTGITTLKNARMIKIDFPALKGYPGVN